MSPLIACSTSCYGRFGAQAAIEHVRSVGLDALQIPIPTAGEIYPPGEEPLLSSASNDAEVRHVEGLLSDNGVRIASCQLGRENPLSAKVVTTLRRKLDLARRLGVDVVVGGAGDASDTGELATLHRHLRKIGDHAQSLGITYCCDTLPGICVNHRWMLRTMQEVDHPNVRLNFDTGNLLYYNEDPIVEIALAKCCHLVRHVHLKDSMGEHRHWYFPALGYGGAVDFLRVYQLMRDVGFRGPYCICVDGIEGEGDVPLLQIQKRIKDSIGTLQECGYFDKCRAAEEQA